MTGMTQPNKNTIPTMTTFRDAHNIPAAIPIISKARLDRTRPQIMPVEIYQSTQQYRPSTTSPTQPVVKAVNRFTDR
jgi:hypothetical protein